MIIHFQKFEYFLVVLTTNLFQRQVESCNTKYCNTMVVVTSLGPPEEGVRLKVDNVATFINRKQLGMGALFISEARVSWVGIQGQGFSLEYPHIALHAVSRDLTQFHQECLYLMIDVRLVDETGTPMSTPTSSDAGSDSDNEVRQFVTHITPTEQDM